MELLRILSVCLIVCSATCSASLLDFFRWFSPAREYEILMLIIDFFFCHVGCRNRTRTDAATSPNIAMYVVLTCTYCATEEAQIAHIRIMSRDMTKPTK